MKYKVRWKILDKERMWKDISCKVDHTNVSALDYASRKYEEKDKSKEVVVVMLNDS